ncbi:MAG: GyrI-like domain-containing protein [Blastocatellia bacterium]
MEGTATTSLGQPRLVDGKALVIVGLRRSYTTETAKDISQQWERFGPYIGKISGQIGNIAYGVCFPPDSDRGFDYLSGVEVSHSFGHPEDFSSVNLPAQKYAVFTHREHVSKLGEIFDAIFKDWFPKSGYEPANAPCLERYGEKFDPRTGMGDVEVWVPVKA